MGRFLVFLMLLSVAATAAGQDPRREQVEAAVGDAVDKLREQIGRQPIVRGVTVQDLLDRTDGHDELSQLLRRSQQIGGPRWIDGQTTQVQLEMSGGRVARALVDLAAAQPKKAPIPAETIAASLRDWRDRTFSATGSSMAAAGVASVRPPTAAGAWADVSEEARQSALAAARADAAHNLIHSVRDVELAGGRTVGEALEVPAARESIEQWIASRPVTSVRFLDDMRVEIRLAAEPEEFAEALRTALGRQRQVPVPPPDPWQRVKQAVEQKMAEPVGVGRVSQIPSDPESTVTPSLEAPEWIDRTIEAEATASDAGSRLRTARAAEARALDDLASQVGALRLPDGSTLADAAQRDPRVGKALQRGLRQARTRQTDYLADGGVRVRVSLDLRDVWEAVRSSD